MSNGMVYRPTPDLVVRKVGDESVLVPVRTHVADLDAVVTLNPVASRVWELLDGNRSIGSIVETICDEYEVTAGTAQADVAELLRSLEDAHLIERVAGAR